MLSGVDLVVGERAARRVAVPDHVDDGAVRRVVVARVVEDAVDRAVVLPALEDVADGVARRGPVEVGRGDDGVERRAVLLRLAAPRGEPARGGGELAEAWGVEAAAECIGEGGVRTEDERMLFY